MTSVKSSLPQRVLTRHELRELVDSLAATPDRWRDLVAFPDAFDAPRHFALLHRDQHVDVWLLCWTPENDTGWHDHDISSGAVRVVQGAIKECNPRLGGPPLETLVDEGTSFSFGPDHIHRLIGAAARSVSIHAYSPPLTRMGQYSFDGASGVMRRVSVGYADELKPLDNVA